MQTRRAAIAIVAGWLVAGGPAGSLAQSVEEGSITGRIVDAESGEPLAGSVVVLVPGPGGFMGRTGSPLVPSGWRTTTESDGSYRFGGLPAGPYVLLVSRFAYKPARVEVDLVAVRARVSVGLVVEPIAMEPRVVVLAGSPAGEPPPDPAAEGAGRIAAERARQERFLATDARRLGREDVVDAVTLVETDLFRALQRLPGVTTRDDYTAELWTRGAPWSHTRVTFDGMPLFSPLHGVGVFSGVNSDAIGAAFFHPGVRSASVGEGAAAVVDLASRPATAAGELHGSGELSLVSARVTLDRGLGDGRGGWMVAGRRSYLDLVSRAVEKLDGGSDDHIAYDFHDLVGRLDLALAGSGRLEASAFWAQDAVRDEIPGVEAASPSRWGDAAARVTAEAPWGGLRARQTVGFSRHYARGVATPRDGTQSSIFDPPGEPPSRGRIDAVTVLGEIRPPDAADYDRWAAGYAISAQRQSYEGQRPSPYPGRTSLERMSIDGAADVVAGWVERRWRATKAVDVEAGIRLEAGSEARGAEWLRPAPRATVRYRWPDGRGYLSAGYARSYQYAQVLAPAGLSVGPRLHPGELWLLAGDSLPALRADLVTLGAEAWLGGGWLASATAYERRVEGYAVPVPGPGEILTSGPFLAIGSNRARGVELSLRRLVGRVTGSLAYTLGASTVEADGWRFPAGSDRRHALDAAVIAQASERVRVGLALSWASGAPYTRFYPATIRCDPDCAILAPARVEAPNAERTGAYASLDGLVEWTKRNQTWDLTVYGVVENLLDRDNAITYRGSLAPCVDEHAEAACEPDAVIDRFDSGLPLLPTVGVRVSF